MSFFPLRLLGAAPLLAAAMMAGPVAANPPGDGGHLCVDVRIGTESTSYLDCINAELRDVVSREDGKKQVLQMAVEGSAPMGPSQSGVFNQAASNEQILAYRHKSAPPPPIRPGLPR